MPSNSEEGVGPIRGPIGMNGTVSRRPPIRRAGNRALQPQRWLPAEVARRGICMSACGWRSSAKQRGSDRSVCSISRGMASWARKRAFPICFPCMRSSPSAPGLCSVVSVLVRGCQRAGPLGELAPVRLPSPSGEASSFCSRIPRLGKGRAARPARRSRKPPIHGGDHASARHLIERTWGQLVLGARVATSRDTGAAIWHPLKATPPEWRLSFSQRQRGLRGQAGSPGTR
jgi:hypothetical protein